MSAAILLITAYRSVHQFDPGRIDHHNIQIVLAAVSLFGVLGAFRRARWAILPGLAGALAITIGVEGVPYVVAAALTLALAALGGILGAVAAYLLFDGISASTLGGGFTQVVFSFAVTPASLFAAMILAIIVGFLAGFFPAMRAARVPLLAVHQD